MDWVQESFLEVEWGRHVVSDTGGSEELGRSALTRLPDAEHLHQDVVGEARVEHLADQEDVGAQSRLQHDRHVGGIEKTDGIRSAHTTLAGGLDRDLNTEALEIDDGGENQKSREEVHDVGEVLAVKGLLESALLVGPGEQEVEESNDGTLEFGTTAGINGCRGESLPDDRLADVGRDEQRNTAAKSISLLQELIEQNDNETSNDKLDDQQNANTSAQITGLTV